MSMTSILGFLILVGTVVNNGILYVDTVNQYRMEMPLRKALIEAETQGCRSAEEYRMTNPIGAGRNRRVDRPEPSGNDFLKNAARRRPLTKKKEDSNVPEP